MLNFARQFLPALRWWLCALWLLAGQAFAQSPLMVPELKARVMDFTSTLTTPQQTALTAKLAEFEKAKGTQIVVLMVPTTQPETIEAYTHRVASTWKIGRKEMGDGLLLVVAKNDRKLRIEVAKSLEGAITDLQAKRVIDQDITPRFRQGDFAGGIGHGLDALMKLVEREALPAPKTPDRPTWMPKVLDIWVWVYGVFGVLLLGATVLANGLRIRPIVTAVGFTCLAAVVSAALGLWAWFSTGSALWTHVAAALGFPVSFLVFVVTMLPSGPVSHARTTAPRAHPWARATAFESSRSRHSSPDLFDSFSSGGGGDFGGGGASGDW